MLYLFAAIGAVTVGILLWRLMHADDEVRVPASYEEADAPGPRGGRQEDPTQQQSKRVVGPDDDPEFLRSLNKDRPES